MKITVTCLSLALFLLTSHEVWSQESTWFDTGTSWIYNFDIGLVFTENRTVTFQISEQTTLNGVECARMELLDDVFNPCNAVDPPYYFYESNDSIFYATEYDNTFRLAYDFNADAGDDWHFVLPVESFETLDTFLVNVISVSAISLSGQDLKVMELGFENISDVMHSTMEYREYTVTEKLGSDEQFFIPIVDEGGEFWACEGAHNIVLQCYNSTDMAYTNPDFQSCTVSSVDVDFENQVRIYPNPSAGDLVRIEMPEFVPGTLSVLDMTGRVLLSQNVNDRNTSLAVGGLSRGVYLLSFMGIEGISFSRKVVLN